MNTKRKIYRVEDSDGVGVYQHWIDNKHIIIPHLRESESLWVHPSPHSDPGIDKQWYIMTTNSEEYKNYKFGFTSIEQYKKWFFDEHGRQNAEDHLRLCIYELEDDCDLYESEHQCIFEHEKATLTQYISTNC